MGPSGKATGIVLTIDHPDLPKDYKKEWEENTMERQLVQKNGAPRKRRSVLSEVQSGPRGLAHSDNSQRDESLLVSTARRIGSVLGKIVAKTENPLSPPRPTMAFTPKTTVSPSRKTSAERESPEPSKKSSYKAVSKTQVKGAHSVRRSRSKNVKQQSRANRPGPRKVRRDQQ